MKTCGGARVRPGAAGFSLMEAIVATVVSVIAVIALAYSFGYGRAFIGGFGVRRVAEGAAQACMDSLGTLPAADAALAVGPHSAVPFACNGTVLGTLSWQVTAPPTDAPPTVAGALREVKVTVTWKQGGMDDSLSYTRLVQAP